MKKLADVFVGAAIILAVGLFATCTKSPTTSPTTQADPKGSLHLRFGYVPTLEGLPVYVAIQDGYFRDSGFQRPELVKYKTSDLAIVALLNGEVELAFAGAAQAMIAGQQSPGKLKILSLTCSKMAIVAGPGKPEIHSAKDLRGVVGVFPGSVFEKLVVRTFSTMGGDPSRLDLRKIPADIQPTAIGDRSVDAIWTLEPYGTLTVREKGGRFVTQEDLFAKYLLSADGYPGAAVVVSSSLLARSPDAARNIAAALKKADDRVHSDHFDPAPYLARCIDIDPKRIQGLLPERAFIGDQIPRALYLSMAKVLKELGELPLAWSARGITAIMALAAPIALSISELKFASSHDIVVKELELRLVPGRACVLFGPNGCGKSSTLRYLLEAGDLVAASALHSQLLNVRRLYVPQRTSLAAFHWLSPVDNVAVPFRFGGESLTNARASAWRTAGTLLERLPTKLLTRQLSGGQQAMVVLARAGAALSTGDIALFLNDEGYASLDYQSKIETAAWLRERCLSENAASITVAHDAELAAFLADEILILSRRPARVISRIVVDGPRHRSAADLGSSWLANTIQSVQAGFERALHD